MNNRDETREALMALLSEVTDRVEKMMLESYRSRLVELEKEVAEVRGLLEPLRPVDGKNCDLVLLVRLVVHDYRAIQSGRDFWRREAERAEGRR